MHFAILIRRHILITLFLSLSFNAFSQFRDFLKNTYIWEHDMVVPDLDSNYMHENAVALNEKNRIAIRGLKEEFMHVYFEKQGIIQFKNENGIRDHGNFLFPYAMDPLYERQFIPIDEKIYSPYFNTKVLFVAGRIIHENGIVEPAIFRYSFPDVNRIVNKEYERAYRYYIEVINLRPGDVLEYHYKYEVPMDVNWMHFNSGRIFHHSTLAKQDYELKLEYNKKLRNTISGDAANSIKTEDKVTTHIWTKKNLDPIMREVASRPFHGEHVIFKFNENNLSHVFQHPRTGQILPSPFYTYMIKKRQARDHWYRRVALRKLVLDRQGRQFRNWVSDVTDEIDGPLGKLNDIQKDISLNFTYDNDILYYSLQDLGLEQMGTNIQEKRLRDISRHTIYTKLFNQLGFSNYKVLYSLDNRAGEISKEFTTDLFFNERIYFSNDGDLAFVHPKRSQTGFLLNEIPFYWQGSNAIGYSLDELFDEDVQSFNMIKIPANEIVSARTTNSVALVNIKERSIDFVTDLQLSGQFSTLTRGLYLHSELDSTINPNYGSKIFELGGKIFLKKNKLKNLEGHPNFQADFQLEYLADKKLAYRQDNVSIPLQGFFNFVLWNDTDFENRYSTFYPDFAFTDVFEYELIFDVPVKIGQDVSQNLTTKCGSFKFEVIQKEINKIELKAKWVLNEEPIPASEIGELEILYEAMINVQKSILKIQLKD